MKMHNNKPSFEQFVSIIKEKMGDTSDEEGIANLFNLCVPDGSGVLDF
jgi:hypothetical protein